MTVENSDPFALSRTGILEVLMNISREAVEVAKLDAYEPMPSEHVVDAERFPAEVSAGEQLDSLGGLESALTSLFRPRDVSERVSGFGEHQARVDQEVHRWITAKVTELLGDAVTAMAGEESGEQEWDEFLSLEPGRLGVLIDAVDGTTNQRLLRSVFANNMGLYRALGQREFELLGYVVTTSSGETQLCDLTSVTMVGPNGVRLVVTDEDARSGGFPWGVAAAGARPEVRREFSALHDPDLEVALPTRVYAGRSSYSPAPDILTVGGAPIIAVFPLSELEYCVNPHGQSPYDAFPLLGAVMSGHRYYRLDTSQELPSGQLRSLLSIITGPRGLRPKPVPAGLLVRFGASQQTTQRLLDELRRPVVSRV